MLNAIFAARILGPLYLLVSLGVLMRSKDFMKVYHETIKSPALMYFAAFISLLIGLVLVNTYHAVVADWTLLVTLVGWAALIKGLVLLFIPELGIKWSNLLMKNKSMYMGVMVVVLLFGAFLCYKAYWVM